MELAGLIAVLFGIGIMVLRYRIGPERYNRIVLRIFLAAVIIGVLAYALLSLPFPLLGS